MCFGHCLCGCLCAYIRGVTAKMKKKRNMDKVAVLFNWENDWPQLFYDNSELAP